VDRAALEQVFSKSIVSPASHSTCLLHIYHHLSLGAGTIGQIVATVPSGLDLTPPQETAPIYTVDDVCSMFVRNIGTH
jgi:hypothetical protein